MQIMDAMVVASLLVNVAVLLPVCAGLIRKDDWARACFGEATPARGILLSIYVAIGFGSLLLLIGRQPALVALLLGLQIVYKITTPFTVGTIRNPVVISNLAIAAFHLITLGVIWGAIGNPFF